jgi:hypothetical protein
VDPAGRRGARAFLQAADELAQRPGAVLWVTAQGGFVDPRARPVRLQPGLSHLAGRWPSGWLIPMALEYPFWQERLPEALMRLGPAVPVTELADLPRLHRTTVLERALQATQDRLADDALSASPERFETLLRGASGMGNVYERWQRLRARVSGRPYQPEHAALQRERD